MRKILSASPLVSCVLGALVLYGCSGNSLSGLTENLGGNQAPQPPAAQTQHTNGLVEDWSTSHLIYPRVGSMNTMKALQSDVRAMQSWRLAEQQALQQSRVPRRFLPLQTDAHRDWSISLGGGSVAPAMYPAKFGFNINATPDCTNDVAIFTVNTTTSSTQPNIVGFNNLYSGGTSAAPTGLCGSRAVVSGDNRSEATVDWGYNVVAADGQVSTSPALSLDGQEVAFVETGSGATAHFHVLAPSPEDGVNFTTPNLQDVTQPITINSTFGFATILAETTGNATDLPLNIGTTQSDTLSSPFIDYANNLAYVGNDSGELFRIQNVFCVAGPTVCNFNDGGPGAPAPSLDTSWGSGTGAIHVCSGELTGPVVDGGTGNVFVGCSDGNLYGFTNTGTALPGSPVAVGNGSGTGGIVDPPLIDSATGLVYAVAGSNGGSPNSQVVVQVPEVFTTQWTLGTPVIAKLGAGGLFNLHAPAVNDAYLTGGPGAAGALLYEWAIDSGHSEIELYGFGFTGTTMNTTPAGSIGGGTPVELSPVTELDNAGVDQLFVSGQTSTVETNFIEYNINSFPTTFLPSGAAGATATEGNGTSGIIVDNVSSDAQASSIYFGVLGGTNMAVKLTQSGLQ